MLTSRVVAWSDAEAVRLRRAMYDDLAPLYPELFVRVEAAGGFPWLDERQSAGVVLTLLVEDEGVVVGCAGLRALDDDVAPAGLPRPVAELVKVFVLPQARRRGVARRAVLAAEGAAVGLGYAAMVLETGSPQAAALALYRSLGYQDVPPYGSHVGDPVSACLARVLA